MSDKSKDLPPIIKKKKVVAGGGHHGGAWKVAYADFVTAMMAFFLLMWLLNATTEKQRKGLADYFAPTIAVNRVSGGGDGTFGGESVFSEETLAQNGTGASAQKPTAQNQARGEMGGALQQQELFKSINKNLVGHGGESQVMENALEHIITRVTDEGVVIEIFATADEPLFDPETREATQLLEILVYIIADAAKTLKNGIAIEGHVPTGAIVLADNPIWERSVKEANILREMFHEIGLSEQRIKRVTGHADREPAVSNPLSVRNHRLEIIFLK